MSAAGQRRFVRLGELDPLNSIVVSKNPKIQWWVLAWLLVWLITPAMAGAEAEKPISLEVTAPRATLREGEKVQIKVTVKFSDGSTKDVTSTMTGTRYLTTSLGRQLAVDPNGLVTALSTEGWVKRSDSVYVFYRSFTDVIEFTIVKRDALEVTAPKTTLRVGESVQLKVAQVLPGGSKLDITDPSTGTTYLSTDQFKLVPEPDGRVTCVGTRGKAKESAIIGIRNGELLGEISFELLAEGPGPSLEVVADNTVLQEGGQTQIEVFRRLPNGRGHNVTAASTGTRYLIFTGVGKHKLIAPGINVNGLVSAPDSIRTLTRLPMIVFARNGSFVGWIELNVLPRGH